MTRLRWRGNFKLGFFLRKAPASSYKSFLINPNMKGAQIIYDWKTLEPKENVYNFDLIDADLKFLRSIHKEMFIQIQDRPFGPNIIPFPDYLYSKRLGFRCFSLRNTLKYNEYSRNFSKAKTFQSHRSLSAKTPKT